MQSREILEISFRRLGHMSKFSSNHTEIQAIKEQVCESDSFSSHTLIVQNTFFDSLPYLIGEVEISPE